MAVKKDKSLQRGVSQAKCETSERIVLVGTYKGDQLTDWRGWYNYPISDEDKITDAEAAVQLNFWDIPQMQVLKPSVPFPSPVHQKFTLSIEKEAA